MNRSDITQLQAVHSFPSVTILLPTEQRWPESRQNPIRVGNLVREAEERLRSECSARIWTPLIERLDALANRVDYEHLDAGLALFVNAEIARSVTLPFPVRERVVVDETFAVRYLVAAEQYTPRYLVLVLSEQPTRLFAGRGDRLTALEGHGFPVAYEGPGPEGTRPLPGGRGTHTSEYRDEYRRQFFRAVDEALGTALSAEPLPVVVAGVERYLAMFEEITAHRQAIVATVTGNYDATLAQEIAAVVWPKMQAYVAQKQQDALDALAAAVNAARYVSGIEEIWRVAQEGRGATLLVEEGFAFPALVDPSGMAIHGASNRLVPGVIDDAVNELVETVVNKGGTVVFVPDGTLTAHQRAALILRY